MSMPSAPTRAGRQLLLLTTALATLPLASAAFAQDSQAPSASSSKNGDPGEIVVTAQRRSETLQSAAADISALGGDTLLKSGSKDFRDYLASVPGVSYAENGGFKNKIFIRGLADAMGSRVLSTTGIYLDEVPLTEVDSTLVDVGTFDIDRVEVLKGPQGTLYGSSSMGGTVRIITKKPDASRFAAAFDGTLSTVNHGGTNYQANAMVNIPLVQDRLALRVVGSYRHDAGFVDNSATGATDINDITKKRLRAQLKWDPSPQLDVLLSFQYDKSDQNYGPFQDLGAAHYTINRLSPEYSRYVAKIYNATVSYDLGFASLLSTTSYIDKSSIYARDFSAFDIPDIEDMAGISLPANTGASLLYHFPNKLFTQEVRLSSNGEGPLKWLVGGYYSNFMPTTGQDEITTSPLTDGLTIYHSRQMNKRKEYAGFGEVSYDITPRLELTAGVRVFKYTISSHNEASGLFETGDLSGAVDVTDLHTSNSSHVTKFRAAYKATENNLIFAQASQGYRVGGPIDSFSNTCLAGLTALGYTTPPTSYKPDKLWDYEIGSKNSFFNRKMTLNATAFYIDWKDVQLAQNLPCGSQFISNAGGAHSRGAELEMSLRPVRGLELQAGTAWTKSTFTDTNSQTRTIKGGDLPNVPRWSASGSAQYTYEMRDGAQVYLRSDVQYVGSRLNDLVGRTSGLVRQPAYTLVNGRLGFMRDFWELAFFVTNITNERAIYNTSFGANSFQTVSTPRTMGVNFRVNY